MGLSKWNTKQRCTGTDDPDAAGITVSEFAE
jgi:hypothetical protein